jgi:hypothetical protein
MRLNRFRSAEMICGPDFSCIIINEVAIFLVKKSKLIDIVLTGKKILNILNKENYFIKVILKTERI